MLANCDAVVLNTLHEEKFVRDRASVRLEVAGVGIHPQAFERRNGDEVRARHHLGRNPVVGFVGRQDPEKGVVRLLHAMRIVWEWNYDVRLVLAGARSPQCNNVDTMIGDLPQFERQRIVRINNFPEKQKASIYDALDVFVLPSTEESFGISYLEAWMCRKPVIGARIGSTECVINEGVDGLLVDPSDPDDIARALIELLSDSNMRDRMGRSGHDKTIAQYTWENITNKMEKLYLELAAPKGTRCL
jgi:glycosyltransferase involved in cell wall biosynthesis